MKEFVNQFLVFFLLIFLKLRMSENEQKKKERVKKRREKGKIRTEKGKG